MRALARNLLAGLRLFAFLPVEPSRFAPSARQVVLLAAVALGAWIALDRLPLAESVEIDWFTVQQVVAVGALAAGVLVLLAPRSPGATVRWATGVAAASPFLMLLGVLLKDTGVPEWMAPSRVLAVIGFAVVYRAFRLAAPIWRPAAAARSALVVACASWLFESVLYGDVEFWFAPETEETVQESEPPGQVEQVLFRQPDLVDAALSKVVRGTPGRTEAYFLGFAGFGRQHVFDKEVRFARAALAERIDLAGRSLELINTPEPDAETPLATMSGLRRALGGIGKRMNRDEDVLVLFLTSHGAQGADLSVVQAPLPLEDLHGDALRQALDEAGIRWRIVLISACHSGSFIPFLEDPQTLVATASRADRKALGCSEERELTYFGEALFHDALPASGGLLSALERVRELVAAHERAEEVPDGERSEPQLFVGERMRDKLTELEFRPAR